MKNSKSILFIISIAVLVLSSCDNKLNLKPISEETSDIGYTNASQLEAALVGAYESFQSAEYYVSFRMYDQITITLVAITRKFFKLIGLLSHQQIPGYSKIGLIYIMQLPRQTQY